ncbi:MAG: hypothetical protein M1840_002758 [Geoglossum simile]|nr:MAG: hypothetical protein M1840_002758 [Geoglossum simile]
MSEPASSIPSHNGKTVVITGINGYLASVIGLAILKKGYKLIGTCRSDKRAQPLLEDAYAEYYRADRVKIVEVVDMTKEGAFDEVVKGKKTPPTLKRTILPNTLQALMKAPLVVGPAIAGTTGILHSALKCSSSQLSAVVITSSLAAIVSPGRDVHTYTEDDWNNYAEEEVEKAAGEECSPLVLYAASKTAAEKAVWAFREKEKPPFAISSLNPTIVYGPPIIKHPNPTDLNETLRPMYQILTGTTPDGVIPPKMGSAGYIDVRDVATAHIWALEHPSVSDGHRYIASAGLAPPQAIADVLREIYPNRRDIIPLGTPGEGYVKETFEWLEGGVKLSARRLEEAMGNYKWILLDRCIKDTAKYMERYLEGAS